VTREGLFFDYRNAQEGLAFARYIRDAEKGSKCRTSVFFQHPVQLRQIFEELEVFRA
jgi:hypothetical protein